MPAFSAIIPVAPCGDSFKIDGVGEVYADYGVLGCMACARATHWIEVCANGPICSTECSKRFWDELNEACKKVNERQAGDETGSERLPF